MKANEFVAYFIVGVGVVWLIEIASILAFRYGWNLPNVPLIGSTGLIGGLAAVLLIWLLKEKKIRFIPLSI